MEGRSSPSKNGLFAESKAQEPQTFGHKIMLGSFKVVFSFMGPKEEVKKRVREILQDDLLPRINYIKKNETEESVRFDIYIPQNNYEELTRMFWYLGKITKQFYDETKLVHDFVKKSLQEKKPTPNLYCLYRSAKEAKERESERFIAKDYQPKDQDLWTKQEIEAWQEKIKAEAAANPVQTCRVS